MKKSDFARSRRDLHRRRWTLATAAVLDDRTKEDVEAAEAAGVVWDPEEPKRVSLPDSLTVVKTGQNCGRLAYFATRSAIADLTLEELDEVKRRCDAWPELEKLAVGDFGDDRRPRHWSDRLRDILRGGAS